jgi:hypothetical protein
MHPLKSWGLLLSLITTAASLFFSHATETDVKSRAPKSVNQGCTMYVSPYGMSTSSGTSLSAPTSLLEAAALAEKGSVVCILAGNYLLTRVFQPEHSGTRNAWITFKSFGDGDVNIAWDARTNAADTNMFHFYGSKFPHGPSYIKLIGLKLDGKNKASNGFFCQGSHHLSFIRNTVVNVGSAGIGSVLCDYLVSDSNVIYHNGYNGGWSSGISYNSNQWYDDYPGLHSVVARNMIAGEFDSSNVHSDGNGIIMDLSNRTYDPHSANTPPALIINNIVYGNGGRCIHTFTVTDIWVINNTCYANGLDMSSGGFGSVGIHNSSNEYFLNNIVVTWNDMPPFIQQGTRNQHLVFRRNLIFGGANSGFTDADPSHFRTASPRFRNPPVFKPSLEGQYANTLNPLLLDKGLELEPGSPGVGWGIDPTLLSSESPVLTSDLKKYVYSDITGKARPYGGPFDLGAYQH